jgi:Tol biopolymer transport system component
VGAPVSPKPLFDGQNVSGWYPTSWSQRHSTIAVYTTNDETGYDIRLVSTNGANAAPLLATPFSERAARFSPDSAWLAYVSDESGRDEVYVRPYSGSGAGVPVSLAGGSEPVWAPSGRELFYRMGDQLLAVPLQFEPTLAVGVPRLLFQDASHVLDAIGNANYDIFPDGQRFVMIQETQARDEPRVVVVQNWHEELKQRVPIR